MSFLNLLPEAGIHSLASVSSRSTNNNYTALIIGHFFSLIGFGFTFFQTYSYFTGCSGDSRVNKICVGLLGCLDTVITILVSRRVYHELVSDYWVPEEMSNLLPTLTLEFLLSAITICVAQLFYSHQIWIEMKALPLSILAAVMSVSSVGLWIVTSVCLFKNPAFSTFSNNSTGLITSTALGLTFVVALMHSVVFGTAAYRKGLEVHTLGSFYDRFILCFVDPGVLATAAQLVYFIIFILDPSNARWMPLHLLATKLFINACLSFLTSKEVEGSLVSDTSEWFTSRISTRHRSSIQFQLQSPIHSHPHDGSLHSLYEGGVDKCSPPGKDGSASFPQL